MQMLDPEFLRTVFDYSPETGDLIWKVTNSQRAPAGSIAGSVDGRGYISVGVNGRRLKAHRVIWAIWHNETIRDDVQIDHINRDRVDNRIVNLRKCDNRQNQYNAKRNNKTGYKGVCLMPEGNYLAYITIAGKRKYIGRFDRPEDAAMRYDSEAAKHFGEFARLNFQKQ